MTPIDDLVRASLRGSFVRRAIAEILDSHGPLAVEHLADLLGQEPRVVRWALDGYGTRYCRELGLERIGLVACGRDARYGFTPEGRAAWLRVRPAVRRGAKMRDITGISQ